MSGGPIESRPEGEVSGQLPPEIHRNPDHSDQIFQREYRDGHRNVGVGDPSMAPRITPLHERATGFEGTAQRSPEQGMGVLPTRDTAERVARLQRSIEERRLRNRLIKPLKALFDRIT